MQSWERYFPFSSIREEQRQAINFAIESFSSGKKAVIAELGTGVGKSAIGIAIARYYHNENFENAYILTTQKLLQDQYMNDFSSSGLSLLKSSSSYKCQLSSESRKISCSDGQKLLKLSAKLKDKKISPCAGTNCAYIQAKQEFFEASEGITNYSYFLATNAFSYQKMPPRELLILDEGHNIENVVTDFVKISFSNHFYKNILKVRVPNVDANQHEVYQWLSVTCTKKLKKVISDLKSKYDSIYQKDSIEAIELSKQIEELETNLMKVEYFKKKYDSDKWILDVSNTDKRGERIYEFKPLDVSKYVRDLLIDYASKVLILSATIIDVDVFCETNCLSKDEVAYIRIPSPFPVSNRPILYTPVGSMSKKKIDETLPFLAESVKQIIEHHKNEKGIIHCGSFKIANFIQNHLKNDRILSHESSDRTEVLKKHKESQEPTILLSPSMTEGVDLVGDYSRFQIVCKIPFPYLGDVVIKHKMETNPAWYKCQTVKTLVQSLGRSIRNSNDHAVSYILDSDWERFYQMNSTLFPPDFHDCIVK